jgi:hypothetical protein
MHSRMALRNLFLSAALVVAVSSGVRASGDPLASYEADEAGDLSVSCLVYPTSTCVWPQDASPIAPTEGARVLKWEWTNEADRKVEIRHSWSSSSFDLAGYDDIQVDLYFGAGSGLPAPGKIGIWDDVFDWVEGVPAPASTGEWTTVCMNVRHLDQQGLDHIYAFLLEDLDETHGVVYVDNLRLVPHSRQLDFAGYSWTVKVGDAVGPGPNNFTASDEDVWVDDLGHLHLKVSQRCNRWNSSEVILDESMGYGTYVFSVSSRVDFDENIVLGLFTWDTDAPEYNYREIDFEFGRWGDPASDNAQFVVQPWDTSGNRQRFDIVYPPPPPCPLSADTTTHVMKWSRHAIEFSSYYGDFQSTPPPGCRIASWLYTGSDNPPPGGENVRMNLWLMNGLPPVDGEDAEVVISHFHYVSTDVPAIGRFGLTVVAVLLVCMSVLALARQNARARGPSTDRPTTRAGSS